MTDKMALHKVVAVLMRQAAQAIAEDIDSRLREHGLTLMQTTRLDALERGTGVTPSDVSLDLEVDAGATTRPLDRLVTKGMCRRYRDEADRHPVCLEIRELGQLALKVTEGKVNTVLEWFSGLEGSELGCVRRTLSKVLAATR